jgi:hypothetical protein
VAAAVTKSGGGTKKKTPDNPNYRFTIIIIIIARIIASAWKGVQGEWYGDRIEILVGSGDVYLQFEDER